MSRQGSLGLVMFLRYSLLLGCLLTLVSCNPAHQKSESFYYTFSLVRETLPRSMTAGEEINVPVILVNAGRSTWPKGNVVSLSYHWRKPGGQIVEFNGLRTPMPHTVLPGHMVRLPMVVQYPHTPGTYKLQVDMVHEGLAWFSETGARTPTFEIEVLPPGKS